MTPVVTRYEVEKLALGILPILLSRIKTLGQLEAQRVAGFLQSHPPFRLWESDVLALEKNKATQAIEEFLKV